jgi:hypothetical protein
VIVEIYCTDAGAAGLLELFFASQGIKTKVHVGVADVARLTRGHFNPAGDALAWLPPGEIARDIFEACRLVEERGLRLA